MSESYKVRLVASIGEIEAAQWDACANPDAAAGSEVADAAACERFDPFISHAFLKALEDSGSVGKNTGWIPTHIVV